MSVEIVPSVLSADFGHLVDDVQAALAAGVTKIQIDVMDGWFVPNISVGLPVVRALDRAVGACLDVHLMIERPERFVDAFVQAGADVVTVHVESTVHLHRTIHRVRELGAQAGAAVNPATPVAALDEILPDLDVALVMTVDPGFGGQAFIPRTLAKVRALRARIDALGLATAIQVDGGIDVTTAPAVVAAGATQLVAGSAVFAAGVPIGEAVARLRRAATTNAPARSGRRK